MKPVIVAVSLILGLATVLATAQTFPSLGDRLDNLVADDATEESTTAFSVAAAEHANTAIAGRLHGIYGELNGLGSEQVSVDCGVVTLSGAVADPEDIDRAWQIALRVDGVVAVLQAGAQWISTGRSVPASARPIG